MAGSYGSYRFHALSAHPQVRDVSVDSPTPGQVRITVLARDGSGEAPPEVLAAVTDALTAQDVRPLSDTVAVVSAAIVPFAVEAVLHIYPGPAAAPVLDAALAALQSYVQSAKTIGHDITRSAIYAALHQPSVHRVDLLSPAADVTIAAGQAAFCTGVDVTLGGHDV